MNTFRTQSYKNGFIHTKFDTDISGNHIEEVKVQIDDKYYIVNSVLAGKQLIGKLENKKEKENKAKEEFIHEAVENNYRTSFRREVARNQALSMEKQSLRMEVIKSNTVSKQLFLLVGLLIITIVVQHFTGK